MAKDKVVLAYSGGLDTSVAIKWLQEKYKLDVIALAVDVGQAHASLPDAREQIHPMEEIRQKALKIGAIESIVVDAREEFAADFVLPALKANALYEGKYPLVSALSRPLIAKHLVKTAEWKEASYIAHGCTGKGNDQVRFEVSTAALNPSLKTIAPIRDWKMSREEALDYAKKHGIPVGVTKKSPYSIDENLWGRTAECGVLEDPWREPPADVYERTVEIKDAPDESEYLEIGFEKGVPVSLNGCPTALVELVQTVDEVAGHHGFGRVDMIENRLVGIKSREIYEVGGALALLSAHRDLEDLTLERDLLHFKTGLEQKYAELVYYGLWYSPLKLALDAFIEKTQEDVCGSVRLKLHKGNCQVAGRQSDKALYDYKLATYEKKADEFGHDAAKGFIELWGLPTKVWAKKRLKTED